MVRGPSLLIAQIVAFAFGACSLSDGIDGLQGGEATSGGAAGAATGSQGSSTGGAAGRGGAGDVAGAGGTGNAGGGATSGAGGAGGGASGGANRLCEPGDGVFCDDFEAETLGAGWDTPDVYGAGMAISSVAPGNGSARAFRAEAKATSNDAERAAMLRRSFGRPNPESIRCEVDLFLEIYGNDELDLLTFELVVPGFDDFEINFGLVGAGEAQLENFRVDDQGNETFPNTIFTPPPKGEWRRVALDYTGGVARVFYGDTEVSSLTISDTEDADSTEVLLGVTWIDEGNGSAARFDNLVCRYF